MTYSCPPIALLVHSFTKVRQIHLNVHHHVIIMKFTILLFVAGASAASSSAAATTDACLSIASEAPKLPTQLATLFTAADINYCNLHIPKSASKEWSSYTSAQSSFFKAHESALTKCSYYQQYKSMAPTACSGSTAKETGSKETGSKATAKATGSTKSTGSAATGSPTGSAASASKSAGAARETGMAVMAVAAAAVAMAL